MDGAGGLRLNEISQTQKNIVSILIPTTVLTEAERKMPEAGRQEAAVPGCDVKQEQVGVSLFPLFVQISFAKHHEFSKMFSFEFQMFWSKKLF